MWNDARVLKQPALQGAWFSAPDNVGFTAFAQRYKAKFGNDPIRLATLAYDAVSLVAALARTQGAQRYSAAVLTNPSGFNGADGVFRFRPNGLNERGLSVMQINNGAADRHKSGAAELRRRLSVRRQPLGRNATQACGSVSKRSPPIRSRQ